MIRIFFKAHNDEVQQQRPPSAATAGSAASPNAPTTYPLFFGVSEMSICLPSAAR